VPHETVNRLRSLPRQSQQDHGSGDDEREEIAEDGERHAEH